MSCRADCFSRLGNCVHPCIVPLTHTLTHSRTERKVDKIVVLLIGEFHLNWEVPSRKCQLERPLK